MALELVPLGAENNSSHARKNVYRVPLKAGVYAIVVFRLGIMVLTQIYRSCFKQSKSLCSYHISTFLAFLEVVIFFIHFWVYLRKYQRMSEIYEERKIGIFDADLKLEFEVQN